MTAAAGTGLAARVQPSAPRHPIVPLPSSSSTHPSSAAQLPQVELQPPASVIGTNTLDCLLSGGFYGVVDGIDGIVTRILKEWDREEPLVVATGGLADVVVPYCKSVDQIEPVLTVTGLAIADRYLFD